MASSISEIMAESAARPRYTASTAGSDFLSGVSQIPGSLNIAPSFSNVYNPSQTATGGSISIGIPTEQLTQAYAPGGSTSTGSSDWMPMVIMVVIIVVVMFVAMMLMKKKK